jgi:hypothetical protein
MRSSYWSCSKFADWLRGTKKPHAESGSGWKKWEAEAKANHPIRYWLAEEGLDHLQKIVYWPTDKMYNIKYYIVNRWIDQAHALVAHPKHVKPGSFMDLSERMLYCMFDELVDFVEIETAYSNIRWDEEKLKDKKWWQAGKWRLRTYRNREAGLDHLKWASELTDEEWLEEDKKHEAKPTAQAIAATEITELYKWWTEIRPNRPDPYVVSGWEAHSEQQRKRGIDMFDDDPEEDRDAFRAIMDKNREIERQYDEEDTEMLIRLIKVRKSLWT